MSDFTKCFVFITLESRVVSYGSEFLFLFTFVLEFDENMLRNLLQLSWICII